MALTQARAHYLIKGLKIYTTLLTYLVYSLIRQIVDTNHRVQWQRKLLFNLHAYWELLEVRSESHLVAQNINV